MALFVLEDAYAGGRIRPGDRIVEATSGNTGISFAALGRALGHPVTIFMPDWLSAERMALIASLGADVVPVSRDQGGFVGSIALADAQGAADARVFLPHQFSNDANLRAHFTTTGPEIWMQMATAGLVPAAFVAGVGTGGTVMGPDATSRRAMRTFVSIRSNRRSRQPCLREKRSVITGFKASPTSSCRRSSISTELDSIIDVHDGDAILMAQRSDGMAWPSASRRGPTSSAPSRRRRAWKRCPDRDNLLRQQQEYLSTDLLRREPVRPEYQSPQVEILGYSAFSRTCTFCAR